MTTPLDARTLPTGTVLTPDLVIIGGGPAGISLALALADTRLNILLLESGGMSPERAAAALTGISVDNYHYAEPAFYTPEAMSALVASLYRTDGGRTRRDHAFGWFIAQSTPYGSRSCP